MKATGITRHVDELGRIVIPKEIRNSLDIDVNDLLEIYVDNEKIILEKSSKLKKINNVIEKYLSSFYQVIKREIIICEDENIIGTTRNLRSSLYNKKISLELKGILNKYSYSNEPKLINIINGENKYYFIYTSINVNGAKVGDVLFLSLNNDFSLIDNKMITLLGNLFSSYLKY